MHLSYQSILPTHNKLLQKRWDDKYYAEHLRRVKTAGHMVSTTSPKQHPHIVNKLKKQQRESERLEVVQRDNDTLMNHMRIIMDKGSYVDHHNEHKHLSLNYGKRVDEALKIQDDNSKMLVRIKSRPANYSVSEWVADRIEKERLISMITTHPPQQTRSAHPSAVRERKVQSQSSLVHLHKEPGSLETLDPSVTDTIDSLEIELEAARLKVKESGLCKSDLAEVKSFSKPPQLVKIVLEAYVILLGHRGDDLFHVAKKVISQPRLPEIDLDNISISILKKLQLYIENPGITVDKLKRVSSGIVSMWKWIQSVYHYAIISHKYGIRMTEKGLKWPKEPPVIQSDIATTRPPIFEREKFEPVFPLEVSVTDTIESLEIELEAARKKVKESGLCKSDLQEVKSFSNPPQLVKIVLEAYVILLGHRGDDLFHVAKKVISQPRLPEIDLDNISISILKKLQLYIENPGITVDKLRRVSSGIVSMWKWIQSAYHYAIISNKYGIRMTEKGLKWPKEPPVIQSDIATTRPPIFEREKFEPVFPLEVSVTDTIESLEIELEAARKKVKESGIRDLAEVKSFSKPPQLVKIVLEAYVILLGQRGDDLFHVAKKVISQPRLPEIDLDNISISILKKLQLYIENPGITVDTLKRVSSGIVSMWKWIQSAYHYAIISNKYGIRMTEKGLKWPKEPPVIQSDISTTSPIFEREKFEPVFPLEVSVTDTIESLEIELEAARLKVKESGLCKSDLQEVKSFSNPPQLVKIVLEAYVILLGQRGDDLFHVAKKVISQPRLPEIDLDNISISILKKLQLYIENPGITVDTLKRVSSGIVSMWKWIQSVYHYAIISHKYGIRMTEKGLKWPKEPPVIQSDIATTRPPIFEREKFEPVFPLEVSVTDTIESLEIELEAARKKVKESGLCKSDLQEVKSFSNPPQLVKIVLEAYVILLGQRGDDLFHVARKVLAQFGLPEIDLDNISISILKKLQLYIENPEITVDKLKRVSSGIVSMWKWIQSVYHCGVVAYKLDQLHTARYSKDSDENSVLPPN